MHEILRQLSAGSYVLDLGCAAGSFPAEVTAAICVRLDRDVPRCWTSTALLVQADATRLPFADGTFAAVISNHSLEHFNGAVRALSEAGRVIDQRVGSLYVAVPDSSTLTDRLYRWLSRGGGHVNPFTSGKDLALMIADNTGLRHVATRTLFSSLSFLNRRNAPQPRPPTFAASRRRVRAVTVPLLLVLKTNRSPVRLAYECVRLGDFLWQHPRAGGHSDAGQCLFSLRLGRTLRYFGRAIGVGSAGL